MTKLKQPKYRFDGFDGEWEEKKLEEIVEISSGYTGDASLSIGKYLLTRIETIASGIINLNKVGYSNTMPDKKYLLNNGDILFSNINSLAHIGKVAIFSDSCKIYHGINLLRLVPRKVNSYFLYFQLTTVEKRNWAKSHANQAVNQASINQKSLSNQIIMVSSLPEQEAIGDFFQALDQQISQTEEKLTELKALKQTLLNRLFV